MISVSETLQTQYFLDNLFIIVSHGIITVSEVPLCKKHKNIPTYTASECIS